MTNDELDLYYRKILCASIEQAVNYAKGINLYTAAYGDNHGYIGRRYYAKADEMIEQAKTLRERRN